MIGRQLAHYRIVARLGEGGMGEVFRAFDTRLGRDVALKVLPARFATHPDRLYRFTQEAKTVAALSHPGIVTMYSVDESDGVHFLTMELVEGETLEELLPPDGFPVERLLEFAVPIAEALAGAHERGVVHRDLKPGNVMVTDDGHVKVLDFGLAKLAAPEPTDGESDPGDLMTRTKEGLVIGTPHYMAPEQARGRHVDHRADLFAFGVMLFELATGRRPFAGESSIELLSSVLRDEAPVVTSLRPELPRKLGRIIARCLAKEPDERYGDAGELRDALLDLRLDVASGDFELELPADEPPRERTTHRRGRWWAVTAVAALALLALLVVVAPWRSGEGESRAAGSPSRAVVAVLPFENLGSPNDGYFADGVTDEITARLSRVGDLGVISRTSARVYKDTTKSLREIGRELDADFVLEGTIRWDRSVEPGRVRISPRLIRVSDDTQMWTEQFEREVAQVFAVQAEIASHIADALGVTLVPNERAAIAERPTDDVAAYQAYLRGVEQLETPGFDRESFEVGVSMFERAIALDPNFALAHARLASMQARMVHYGFDRSERRVAGARAAAERALELAPDLVEAHLALGHYHYWVERDYDRALAALDAARAIEPDNSEVCLTTAYVKRRQGDFAGALELLERDGELNPLDANAAVGLGETYGSLRRYAEGERELRRAIVLAPNDAYPYTELALLHLRWRGDTAAARATLDEMPPVTTTETCRVGFLVELLDRRYDAALERLADCPAPVLEAGAFYIPATLFEGITRRCAGQGALAAAAFESARAHLAGRLADHPDDPRLHGAIGLAYAGLGDAPSALRHGRRAVELSPRSRDALEAPVVVIQLALIHAMTGDADAAIERLREVLSIPSVLSAAWLRVDPRWDPLRDEATFEALVAERPAP